jgi:aldehyde:ferredoxin oxidoreductase
VYWSGRENKVYAASIEHDPASAPAAGRRGGYGDKKLKAIAVYGTKDINIARPALFINCVRDTWPGRLAMSLETFPVLDPTYHLPMGAYDNFSENPPAEVWEAIKRGKEIGEACKPLKVRRLGCYNCQMRCRQLQRASDGRLCGLKCSAHTRSMIATEIFDGRFNTEFVNLCEKYGLDTQPRKTLLPLSLTYQNARLKKILMGSTWNLAIRELMLLALIRKWLIGKGLAI